MFFNEKGKRMASNSSPIRFAVIGAGMSGGLHAKLISEMEETELVAVCSRDLERARGLTDSFGGEPTTDLEGMLGRADVDAVSICTARAAARRWRPRLRPRIRGLSANLSLKALC